MSDYETGFVYSWQNKSTTYPKRFNKKAKEGGFMDVMGENASNDPAVFLDNPQSNSQQENLQDGAVEEGTGHVKTNLRKNNRPQRTRNPSMRRK